MRSLTYLRVSLRKAFLGQGRRCPSCGCGQENQILDRKWGITTLRRCGKCRLLFRVPTTTGAENEEIYQAQYREGSTTDLPGCDTLRQWTDSNFRNSPHDHATYIAVLQAVGVPAGARIYDFGCSWGYGTFQLQAAGFEAEGYEISVPRAQFAANKLGIRLRSPGEAPDASYDVFFSAHVMEHVPSVSETVALAERLLRPGGWFVAFTPNGSLERRSRDPVGWHQQWGFVHPQLLDREWVEELGRSQSVLAATSPYDLGSLAAGKSPVGLGGAELLIVFRKRSKS